MTTTAAHPLPNAADSSSESRSRLRVEAASCLSVRYPGHECGLCENACPVAAVKLEEGRPVAGGECLGCGQCAARCPTSALSAGGFSLPSCPPTDAVTVFIDCWRVAVPDSPHGAIRVPCLAGLGAGWLLALFDAIGERPICLLDRGGCLDCPAGPGMASLRDTLDEIRALLEECGITGETVPKHVVRPARHPLAPAIPTSADAMPLGRRGFFRDLLGGAVRIAAETSQDHRPTPPLSLRQPVQPIDRMRIVTSLTRIAARHGRRVPPQALPQLSLAECDARGLCAGLCPTGALRRIGDGNGAELRFHAALCVSCGQCARACPDRAIAFSPFGGQAVVEVLGRWAARDCAACGAAFFGAGGDLCPDCVKETNLQHGMTALFQPSA
ncbi:4Fe-4S binding protein [Magnetospirillum sp. SS-4]|uniref:4Fe-4S binding protein n=1 Tax=Magnetospirillum sp. SS-4 TaxID=2681465 RepID=UPI00137D4995|nr:4Fe-4S binding protein [Magnetospirillum sp. SS-4]CAA7616370.1 putative 4Fe-4S ferredoxin, iron-sulfur binding domain protein [Magnetospirillum sp. SS-4]